MQIFHISNLLTTFQVSYIYHQVTIQVIIQKTQYYHELTYDHAQQNF